MTCFNPDVYDYEKLKGEDKVFMDGYNCCIERVKCAVSFVADVYDHMELPPTLGKMLLEIRQEMGEEVLENIKQDRPMIVASLMDGSEEYEVDEKENADNEDEEITMK